MVKVALCFPINDEFIGIIDVSEFGVENLSSIYFYGKFDVWIIIV